MQNKNFIDFAAALLSRLHISSHIIENPENFLSSDIDKGLRAMIFGETDYSKILLNSPAEAQKNTVYRFFDEYNCNYIFFRIPEAENSYFYVGPYISALPTDEHIENKADQLCLSAEQTELFSAYYRKLPVVEDENFLMTIIDTLGDFIWNGTNNFNVEYISYEIPDKRRPVYSSELFVVSEIENTPPALELIEKNYNNEKLLIDAVSKGKLNMVDAIVPTVLHQSIEERLPDSLRNRKNYLIILNTLLRKAAEKGEVHPVHIHRLSSAFAKEIEKTYSIEECLRLQQNMIRKYCILVKEHSLKNHSQLIGRVITLISYDLSAPLTLKYIASTMNVNASYLSSAFRKECGETLTDYVNRKRMENAAYILSHSNKQIQTVAEECGILDVNYFIKIFKKQYGITPSQYRKNIIK